MARSFLLLAGLAVTLGACDFAALEASADDFKIILGIEAQSTVVGGLVVDAATGELIEAPVRVAYVSDVPGLVVDGFGDPIDGETVEGGGFNFAIAADAGPEAGRPVAVAVAVEAEGYLPQRRIVALADTGSYDLTIRMLAPDRPADGAASSQATAGASAQTGTDAPIAVAAAPASGAGAASVSIPQGTPAVGRDGAPIAGDVDVRVTAIDPTSRAVAAFPELPRGVSAVATAVVSTSVAGQPALVAGEGMRVGLALPPTDPATGAPFDEGEELTVIGYVPSAGRWIVAGRGTVVAGGGAATGRSATPFEIELFNGDVFLAVWDGAIDLNVQGGSGGVSLGEGEDFSFGVVSEAGQVTHLLEAPENFDGGHGGGGTSDEGYTRTLTVEVQRNGNAGTLTAQVWSGGGFQEAYLPAGRSSVPFEVSGSATPTSVGVRLNGTLHEAADPATCTRCSVSLPAPQPPVRVTLTPACPVEGERLYVDNLPTVTVSAREVGAGDWFGLGRAAELDRRDDGSLAAVHLSTTALRAGGAYDFRATYLNETYDGRYTVPASGTVSETIDVPEGLCQ